MRKRLIFALLLAGFTDIVAQILLIRELLVTFHGNELSIGIILANWLILHAIGSGLLGRMADRVTKRAEIFASLQILISIFLPLSIYLTRIVKNLIGAAIGEAVGLESIFYSSFLILLPLSLSGGALFAFGCRIYASLAKKDAPSIGKVYILEAGGCIIGGLTFTYLLIPFFHSFQIAFGVGILNLLSATFLTLSGGSGQRRAQGGKQGNERSEFSSKIVAASAVLLLTVNLYLLCTDRASQLHSGSIRRQWRSHTVRHYENSIYGNVTATQMAEQYTIFSDGIPIITTPVPDIAFVEEFVHFPMLAHPSPKHVLLVSGGLGGVLTEILKYPVERVDYAELDPLIIEVASKFSTALIAGELKDPRVNLQYVDGRFLVRRTPRKYDLVMVNLPSPSTLRLNRFYTKEFFRMVREVLKPNGILVFSSPGSLSYLSRELRDLNACIYNTAREVYPYVRPIPGNFNLFLASEGGEVSTLDSDRIIQRLKERAVETRLLTPFHIEERLHQRWLDWFLESLKGSEDIRINRDLLPSGLFYDLSFWNALFSPKLVGLFRLIGKVHLGVLLTVLSLLTLIFMAVKRMTSKLGRWPIPFAIATTGFAGMAFDLVLILAFQSFYGYLYHQIGLLMTAFMVGLTFGSLVMTRCLDKIKKDLACFLKVELSIIIFSSILPLLLICLHSYLNRHSLFASPQIIFLPLVSLSGFLVGAEFPLANKIHLKDSSGALSRVAGGLYACDLFGAWIGALVVSVALIPVLGIIKICFLVLALKISSFLLLIVPPSRADSS